MEPEAERLTERGNRNRSYMKLEVWQRGMDLFGLVWRVTGGVARMDFKLRSQVVDAAQSVSANIAEGYSRQSIHEYLQFLYYALGSLSEVLTRVLGLRTTQQISPVEFEEIDALHYEVENKLSRLIQSLERRRDEGTWSGRLRETAPDEEFPSIHPPIQRSTHPTHGPL